MDGADVLGPDATVDLDRHVRRQDRPQRANAVERLDHERLPRVTGLDAHAEDEVDLRPERRACGLRRARRRLEGEPHLQLMLTRGGNHRRKIGTRFVVHRDAVASGFFDRCEVFLRRLRHQVAVDESTVVMDELRDRLEHDRPHRDRLDEVSVADVVMKDAYARADEHLDLLPESREVGRIDRRLDFRRSDPVVPTHGASLGAYAEPPP